MIKHIYTEIIRLINVYKILKINTNIFKVIKYIPWEEAKPTKS